MAVIWYFIIGCLIIIIISIIIFSINQHNQHNQHNQIIQTSKIYDIYPTVKQNNVHYPLELAQNLYKFPILSKNGLNQNVAIFSFGSWWYYYYKKFNNFDSLINTLKINIPNFNAEINFIKGNKFNPTMDNIDSDKNEALLDIGIISSCCPYINKIYVFCISLDDIPENLKYCVDNNINVINISYSVQSSLPITDKVDDSLFQDYYKNLTICVSSGDFGGCIYKNGICIKNVNYPTSSNYVLSCGGVQPNLDKYSEENSNTWNHSPISAWSKDGSGGGGVSKYISRPSWQIFNNNLLNKDYPNNRLVPDVSGLAFPTWYLPIKSNKNKNFFAGGTSAVAPLYSSFFIIVNQTRELANLPPIGFVNKILYELNDKYYNIYFNDIKTGTIHSGYSAGENYDLATGIGVLNAEKLYNYLIKYNKM